MNNLILIALLATSVVASAAEDKHQPAACPDLLTDGTTRGGNFRRVLDRLAAFVERPVPEDEVAVFYQTIATGGGQIERLYVVLEHGPKYPISPTDTGQIAASINRAGEIRVGFVTAAGPGLDLHPGKISVVIDRCAEPAEKERVRERFAAAFPAQIQWGMAPNRFVFEASTLASLDRFFEAVAREALITSAELEFDHYAGGPIYAALVRLGAPRITP